MAICKHAAQSRIHTKKENSLLLIEHKRFVCVCSCVCARLCMGIFANISLQPYPSFYVLFVFLIF